jgi:hypothetical protein
MPAHIIIDEVLEGGVVDDLVDGVVEFLPERVRHAIGFPGTGIAFVLQAKYWHKGAFRDTEDGADGVFGGFVRKAVSSVGTAYAVEESCA